MNNSSTDGDGLTQNNPMSFTAYPDFHTAVMIWTIYPVVLLVMGGFGNIATICVMRRMKDQNSSQHAIFMALAVSDLSFLCTSAAHDWILWAFRINIKFLHPALCKIFTWFNFVGGSISAWLVTCVTVQRTMAVLWPHRMRVMCTVRRTWIVIALIIVISCVMNVHILIGFDITTSYNTVTCHAVKGPYRIFVDYVYQLLYGSLISFVPFVCQFICDIILSVTLIKAVSSASIATRVESNTGPAQHTDSRKNMSYRTTVMVLAVSAAFLILTTPLVVLLNWLRYLYDQHASDPKQQAFAILLLTVGFQLWYTNSAINFFLYCLTGTKFRRLFINWITCGVKSSSAPSVHETTAEASKK